MDNVTSRILLLKKFASKESSLISDEVKWYRARNVTTMQRFNRMLTSYLCLNLQWVWGRHIFTQKIRRRGVESLVDGRGSSAPCTSRDAMQRLGRKLVT